MAIKKPEWRIFFYPETVDSTHLLFKHMKTSMRLRVGVAIGFKFSDQAIIDLINQANIFMDKNEGELIAKFGDVPPKLCIGQIQNYNDFMIIYKDKTVEINNKTGLANVTGV